jgi:hypothetical protein
LAHTFISQVDNAETDEEDANPRLRGTTTPLAVGAAASNNWSEEEDSDGDEDQEDSSSEGEGADTASAPAVGGSAASVGGKHEQLVPFDEQSASRGLQLVRQVAKVQVPKSKAGAKFVMKVSICSCCGSSSKDCCMSCMPSLDDCRR